MGCAVVRFDSRQWLPVRSESSLLAILLVQLRLLSRFAGPRLAPENAGLAQLAGFASGRPMLRLGFLDLSAVADAAMGCAGGASSGRRHGAASLSVVFLFAGGLFGVAISDVPDRLSLLERSSGSGKLVTCGGTWRW